MKAVFYDTYGSPDQLKVIEMDVPIPKDDEVLVKVHASSINSWDYDLLRGKPFYTRMVYAAPSKPKYKILGADIAGVVESIGKKVTRFKPGDEVYGDLCESGWGGFAEYTCAKENSIASKSPMMSFVEAAATPQAAILASQGIYGMRELLSGQRMLINGAGGGVGTFALQMAKDLNVHVTCVDRAEKLEKLKAWGADEVIDYQKNDFTAFTEHYDFILDVTANRSMRAYHRILSPKGLYAMIGGTTRSLLSLAFMGSILSLTGSRKIRVVIHKPNKDLGLLNELFEAEKVKAAIDKVYPLSETPEAFRYFGKGLFFGKVVIQVI